MPVSSWKCGSMRGEPIKNVPMSLKNDGHKVLIQEALERKRHIIGFGRKVEG